MLTRPLAESTTRPPPPPRSYSSGHQPQHVQQSHRPNLPSRLSSVRSISGPSRYVDLTGLNGADPRNREAWERNKEEPGLRGVKQEVIDLSDDADEGRPRKKAKIETDSVTVLSPEDYEEETRVESGDAAYIAMPGKPMLPPPRQSTSVNKTGPRKRAANDPVRKADGISPPAMATRLPLPKEIADFNPWSGIHPEDVLNEQIVKGGYYDKPPGPSQNESNSARHSIWPNLSQKNNVALQTLSHLFTQVMDQRSNLGRCTAPSSFKPPPRVTVTDTKREAWLKDLANMSIPLRRQSRTIPHGIRGKLLMDQCLAKSIPLQRAVWLAKCVGANELRAFRRKGVSGPAAAQGEAKWIRDWTVSVEQFLESIADANGQDGWRGRIDYAIKLASAFYTEGLLDRDEYLHWIVMSFTSSSLESLPLWTIMVQIYWRDLISFGRRGRKLAEAILEHLYHLDKKGHPMYATLKERLKKLIALLTGTERGCLVVPHKWRKYKHLVAPVQTALHGHLHSDFANIEHRNERLSTPMSRTMKDTRSPLLRLYTRLDDIGIDVDVEELAAQCLEMIPEGTELVKALLSWASTLFRRGEGRVYLAAKIITELYNDGYDTGGAILAFLQKENEFLLEEAKNVWAIIAQLVLEDCFATGRYLQWLIASGVMSSPQQSVLATGLLAALPIDKLPVHVRNLRLTLLRRLGLAVDEAAAIDRVKDEIESSLENAYLQYEDPTGALQSLSMSAKLAVSEWACARVRTAAQEASISASTFCIFRDVLEQTRSLPHLADLVDATTTTDDLQALAAATDTLNMHALDFAIFGVFTLNFDRLVQQHMLLRSQMPLDRTFLLALLRLTDRIPGMAHVGKLLDNDLVAYEQQYSAAVCSPASDSLISMHAGTLETDHEIDAVFASGNTMDEQTMQRVFMRVIQRVNKNEAEPTAWQSRVGGWLNQLRGVDVTELDKLIREYANATLHKGQSQIASTQDIVALVASGCLEFDALSSGLSLAPTPRAASTLLQLLASPVPAYGLSAPELYAYELKRQRFCDNRPEDIAAMLRKATEDTSFSLEANWLLDLTLRTITRHPGMICKAFVESQPPAATYQAPSRLCKAIFRHARPEWQEGGDLDACEVIRSADALNAPFCVGWLRVYLSTATSVEILDKIKDALLEAFTNESEVWPQLLAAAQPATLKAMHEWAREQVLSAVLTTDDAQSEVKGEATKRYCELMDVTYSAVKDEDDAHVIIALTEKLKVQEKELSDQSLMGAEQKVNLQAVMWSLRVLLHVCTLHAQSLASSDSAKQSRMHLVSTLCALMVSPHLQMQQDMLEYIHDVNAVLVDGLPDESVASLARLMAANHGNDDRILSLLGSTVSSDAWLALASRVHLPSAVSGPSNTQQTAQQRALARQPSQPQIAARVPGSGGQQQPQAKSTARPGQAQQPVEMKYTPYPLRRWEIMPDPTPVMGENDCSISLVLFGAKKA